MYVLRVKGSWFCCDQRWRAARQIRTVATIRARRATGQIRTCPPCAARCTGATRYQAGWARPKATGAGRRRARPATTERIHAGSGAAEVFGIIIKFFWLVVQFIILVIVVVPTHDVTPLILHVDLAYHSFIGLAIEN